MKKKSELYILFSNAISIGMRFMMFVISYRIFNKIKIEHLLTDNRFAVTVLMCLTVLLLTCYIGIKRGRSARAKNMLRFLARRATKSPLNITAAFLAMAYISGNPAFAVVAFPFWGLSLLPEALQNAA